MVTSSFVPFGTSRFQRRHHRRPCDPRDGIEFGGWAAAAHDPLLQKTVGEHMGRAWSLLVGRVTYEDLAGFWPRQPKSNPFTDALNEAE